MVILILYGPLVPSVFVRLTLTTYSTIPVEVIDGIINSNYSVLEVIFRLTAVTVKLVGVTLIDVISQSVPVPKLTAGSLILPPVIVLLSVAITVFIEYPTNEGGVTTIVISIKYGPVVP